LLEYTQVNVTVGTPGFSACVYKTALSLHILWLKETQRQRSEEQESGCPRFTLVEKPRCQTLKSRVRSVVLRSCSRNGNRSITGNVTWLTRSDVSHAATHGVPTSAALKDKEEESVRGSISPAISVARTIQCRSNHQRAGRFYAAIVLARVARSRGPEGSERL